MPQLDWIVEPCDTAPAAGSLAPRYVIVDITFQPADAPARVEHGLGSYGGLPCISWLPLASSGFYVLSTGRRRPIPAPAPLFKAISENVIEIDGCSPVDTVKIRVLLWRPELGAVDS